MVFILFLTSIHSSTAYNFQIFFEFKIKIVLSNIQIPKLPPINIFLHVFIKTAVEFSQFGINLSSPV